METITYKAWPHREEQTAAVAPAEDAWKRHIATRDGRDFFVIWHEKDQCWYEEPETVTDSRGYVWENHGFYSDDALAFGGHEAHIVQIAKSLLPDMGVFVDVGAHVGLFSVSMASKNAWIVAFEANPLTFETLKQNFLNNPSDTHVRDLRNDAVWDADGEELNLVEVRGMETGGSTHCAPTDTEESNSGTTRSVTLDTALAEYSKVDLIKIDVEGAEARVLRGASKVMEEHKPTLLIEMHDRVEVYNLPHVRAEVIEILESQNYSWDDSLQNGEESYYIVATPKGSLQELDFDIEVVRSGE